MAYRAFVAVLGAALLVSHDSLRKIAVIDVPGPKGERFDYLTIDAEDHYLLSGHLGPGILYVVDMRMLTVALLCPAQDAKSKDLGKGSALDGKKLEMKDNGEVAYLLSFTAGKEFEATTDGLKNTDVHLFVYDSTGAEVAKDDSSGPKCSAKFTPEKDGQYKFVIKNAGGNNTVTFNVKVAK